MTTKLFKLKSLIKELSNEQKEIRPQRKQNFAGNRSYSQKEAIESMRYRKYDLRHYHIAYCLLKGRDYSEIEKKVRDHNEPSWCKIEEIKRRYSMSSIEIDLNNVNLNGRKYDPENVKNVIKAYLNNRVKFGVLNFTHDKNNIDIMKLTSINLNEASHEFQNYKELPNNKMLIDYKVLQTNNGKILSQIPENEITHAIRGCGTEDKLEHIISIDLVRKVS